MAAKFDAKKSSGAAPSEKLGPLPEWDLSDLYPGRDSAELKRDLERSEADAKAFRQPGQHRLNRAVF